MHENNGTFISVNLYCGCMDNNETPTDSYTKTWVIEECVPLTDTEVDKRKAQHPPGGPHAL